jgi:signal transduction histidine kinase
MNPMAKGSLRALILDENPDDRAFISKALRAEFPESESVWAPDLEGLRRLLSLSPLDLVITDCQFAGTAALDLLADIRAAQPDCPVILFTDPCSERVASEALARGMDDCIPKSPRKYRRLAAAVRACMDKVRLRRRADSLDRKLTGLLNGLEVGVFRVTARGHLLYGNPAFHRILGPGSGARPFSGKLRNLILDPQDQAWIFREMKAHGRVRIPELSLRRPDGGIIWVSLTQIFQPSRSRGGVIDGIVEDITEKKRLDAALSAKEAELLEAQRMESIGKLAAGVAHDFNNLLSAILGYSELLLGADPESPPDRQCLGEIHDAAQRAAGLIRSLLAFGRKQLLFPRIVDMNAILSGLEPALREALGGNIELALALGGGPARIKVDPAQLETVILNLIRNAQDAMPDGGRLEIRTDPPEPGTDPGYFRLSVTDTGCGIRSDIQPRIFEPYFTTKDGYRNPGLGLSTVHGIVCQSGGHIRVDSRPGKGTAIRIFFPSAPVVDDWVEKPHADEKQAVP